MIAKKEVSYTHETRSLDEVGLDNSIYEEPKLGNGSESIVATIPFSYKWRLFWTTKDPPPPVKKEYFFWYPPNQSNFEKKLVFKIDVIVLSYVCLSYFVRYLDANNVSSAYVSGMQEALNMKGNDYNWLNQLFSVAYCISGILTTTLITRLKPHYMLPALEIIWGLCCLFVYKATSYKTVLGLRFVQGFCEGAAWPAIHYILGSWYTPQELGKRASIYTASGLVGILLSGVIQSGLQKNLDGKAGLAGWRWLFIIDACITFPIAFYGFFFFIDTPSQATPKFFLSEEEIAFARDRTRINQKQERIDKFDFSILLRALTSYVLYLFGIAWFLWGLACLGPQYMSIVLKSLGYNIYDRNNIPAAVSGVGILSCLVSGFIVDIRGKRWEVTAFLMILWIIGNLIVVAWDVSRATLIAGYSLEGINYAVSPLIVGWCNELAKEDNQVRAFTLGSLNIFSGILTIPFTVTLFNTDLAPKFTKANIGVLVASIVLFVYAFLILQFDRYQNRKRALISGKVIYD